ncbi:Tetratricopeptide-like helical protein [Nannochloropsis gaditana]|uniref:Tetratricopeptide-like helical protein n=1 Tax=Nannochloropsis gaditana TaxID=72520 RepID=W7TCC6_9STRA|nr:Tetratricopeptide-like helical protein [Nannochloropsis gaditana]
MSIKPTWEAFADCPSTLFSPQNRSASILRKREIYGQLRRRDATDSAAYSPAFTPFDVRRLGFVGRASHKRSWLNSVLKHDGCVNTACWSEDGRILFTAGDDRDIKIWLATYDFSAQGVVASGHSANIFGVQVPPNRPDELVTCAADGTLRRHQIDCNHPVIAGHVVGTSCAPHVMHGFSFWEGGSDSGGGRGQIILTAQGDGLVMMYDLREQCSAGRAMYRRQVPVKAVVTPPVHNTASGVSAFMMYLGGHGATLEAHDLRRLPRTGSKPVQIYRPQGLPRHLDEDFQENVSLSGLAFSKMRGEVLASYQGDQIYGFATACYEERRIAQEDRASMEAWSLGGHVNCQTFLKNVTYFGPAEEYIACGDDSGHSFLWDRRTGMLVNAIRTDLSVANGCVSHPFLPMLACYGIDDTVKVLAVGGRYRQPEGANGDDFVEEDSDNGWQDTHRMPYEAQRREMGRGSDGTAPEYRNLRGSRRPRSRSNLHRTELPPNQYFAQLLEKNLNKVIAIDAPKPLRVVYDFNRFCHHVRRIRKFLINPNECLPDYPSDLWDRQLSLEELKGLLMALKEKGNLSFKKMEYRIAAASYGKILNWLFSSAELEPHIRMTREENFKLWNGDDYEDAPVVFFGTLLPPHARQRERINAILAGNFTEDGANIAVEAVERKSDANAASISSQAVKEELMDLLVSSLLNLAMAVLKQNEYKRAIKLCTLAIRHRPFDAKAYYRRGSAALELGDDYEAGTKDLIKACKLAPNDVLIRRKLETCRQIVKARKARESRAYASFFSP